MRYNINTIKGISDSYQSDGYLGACGIDPDEKIANRIGGAISPTNYESLSAISGAMWFEPNDINTDTYYYTKDGNFGLIDDNNAISGISDLTGSQGNGLAYYNNYYYIATNTDVHRFGPLDTPSMELNWWSGIVQKSMVFSIKSASYTALSTTAMADTVTAFAQSIQETEAVTFRYLEFLIGGYQLPADHNFKLKFSLRNDNSDQPGATVVEVEVDSSKIRRTIAGAYMAQHTSVAADLGTQTIPANTRMWVVCEMGTGWRSGSDTLRVYKDAADIYTTGRSAFLIGADWSFTTGQDLPIVALHGSLGITGKLGNETYSTIGEYKLPNHRMYQHSDNSVYFCDYNSAQGKINRIRTISSIATNNGLGFSIGDSIEGRTSKAKATIGIIEKEVPSPFTGSMFPATLGLLSISGVFTVGETIFNIDNKEAKIMTALSLGKSDWGSEAAALDLPFGKFPIDIASIGTDIGIITSNNDSHLFLWDTINKSFYREILLPFPKATAIRTHNGTPYIWGGDDDGYSISRYTGGNTIEQIKYIDNGKPPLQGAIDAIHNKLKWGSNQTYPATRGCVWALGSKTGQGGLHNVASVTTQVSALHGDFVGDKASIFISGGNYTSIWRSELMSFGRPFDLQRISIPLGADIVDGDTMTITIYYDNEDTNDSFTIEHDTYDNRIIRIQPEAKGVSNAFIEITWNTTTQVPVQFPISIEYLLYD